MSPKNSTPAPEFKFGETPGGGSPSTVQQIAKLDSYIVAYTDGQGKPQSRIVFQVPGSDTVFMLQERIQGSNVATSAHEWFNKAFSAKLKSSGQPSEVESV